MRRNSLLIKAHVFKIDVLPKTLPFSCIPHVCYLSYLPWIAASEGRSLTTLFSTKMKGEEIATTASTPVSHSIREPKGDKKIQAYEKFTLTKGFVFSLHRCSKQSVSRLLTLNWSEHFIRWGCFQICGGNNNTSLLLYACEVIHLINEGVTSPYVRE